MAMDEKAKKKGGLLLAIMGPKKPAMDEEESDDPGTKQVAAQAVLDAIESKDSAALAEAMDSMVKSCMHGGDSEDDGDY